MKVTTWQRHHDGLCDCTANTCTLHVASVMNVDWDWTPCKKPHTVFCCLQATTPTSVSVLTELLVTCRSGWSSSAFEQNTPKVPADMLDLVLRLMTERLPAGSRSAKLLAGINTGDGGKTLHNAAQWSFAGAAMPAPSTRQHSFLGAAAALPDDEEVAGIRVHCWKLLSELIAFAVRHPKPRPIGMS